MTKRQDIARKKNWSIYRAKGNFALFRNMLNEYGLGDLCKNEIDKLEHRVFDKIKEEYKNANWYYRQATIDLQNDVNKRMLESGFTEEEIELIKLS